MFTLKAKEFPRYGVYALQQPFKDNKKNYRRKA